jgi:hypothetical protein
MSKRRNRKSQPNLPEEVLARARREAGLQEEEQEAQQETPEAEEVIEETPPPRRSREPMPQPKVQQKPQRRTRKRGSEPEELTAAEVAERLSNPTKIVTVEQLREQYGYVLADLRSMGLLAGLLFVAMIVVARFL